MTREDVMARLDAIRAIAGDDERAHEAEKGLYVDVLRAIAGGVANADDLAEAALQSLEVKFYRWFA